MPDNPTNLAKSLIELSDNLKDGEFINIPSADSERLLALIFI